MGPGLANASLTVCRQLEGSLGRVWVAGRAGVLMGAGWVQRQCRASHGGAQQRLSRGRWAACPLYLATGSCVPSTDRGESWQAGDTPAVSWLQTPSDGPSHPLVHPPGYSLPAAGSPCSCPPRRRCSLPRDAQSFGGKPPNRLWDHDIEGSEQEVARALAPSHGCCHLQSIPQPTATGVGD